MSTPPLNVGIVSYEKYGMDPMKRNLIGMMFSMIVLTGCVISPMISNSILVMVQLIGPINQHLALGYAFLFNARSNVILLCILEIMGTNVLVNKIWKSVPPINEDFFGAFFFRLNILLGSFFGLVMIMANKRPIEEVKFLTDSDITPADFNFELTFSLFFAAAAGFSYLVSLPK